MLSHTGILSQFIVTRFVSWGGRCNWQLNNWQLNHLQVIL